MMIYACGSPLAVMSEEDKNIILYEHLCPVTPNYLSQMTGDKKGFFILAKTRCFSLFDCHYWNQDSKYYDYVPKRRKPEDVGWNDEWHI
jgi:hypothetical protein